MKACIWSQQKPRNNLSSLNTWGRFEAIIIFETSRFPEYAVPILELIWSWDHTNLVFIIVPCGNTAWMTFDFNHQYQPNIAIGMKEVPKNVTTIP